MDYKEFLVSVENKITENKNEMFQIICKELKDNFEKYDWVGFYFADNKNGELILGPFEGEPTEHTRIPFGKGICGQAASTKKTFVIDDVNKQSNYLSCSIKVKSEIVIPIFKNGEFAGELDIDSHKINAFNEKDKNFLEDLVKMIEKHLI